MPVKGTQSMLEAIQMLDEYFAIYKAERRLKRIFTGLGVDKFVDMFTYRIHNLTPSNVTNLNDQFVAFLQTLADSDESGNTNAGVTRDMVTKCRSANVIYGFLRKKEK